MVFEREGKKFPSLFFLFFYYKKLPYIYLYKLPSILYIKNMKMIYSFESVKVYIEQQGYELLSTAYVTSQIPLEIRCPNGHKQSKPFSEFKRKARCNECSRNKQPTIESINAFLQPEGFKVLSTNYVNNSSKLSVLCPQGHTWEINWLNLKGGNRCPDCFGNRRYTIKEVSTLLSPLGYTIKNSAFPGVGEKVSLVCPKGHDYEVRLHDFLSKGSRCNTCSHQTSQAEQEILSFIQQYFPSAKKIKFSDLSEEVPKEYKNKELDIYVPELRLAIEYCGLFWHSEVSGEKSPKQHRNKLSWCRKYGVRLITIFEDEWLARKEQVKNLLVSVLGVHSVKIGARKCEIKEIDKVIAKQFIDSNHIQGLYMCTVAFGLFFNEELVGVITGSPHHRQNQKGFVLQRLCFKYGYQIQGGASRLLTALCAHAVKLGYSELVSWSDNRISEGNVYSKLGFKLETEYDQDYSYVLNGYYSKRYSKQGLKKTPEERLTGKTEVELRREQGYHRIWDCGKKLWVLSI